MPASLLYVCMCVCICVSKYVCPCTKVHTCVCMCVCVHVNEYVSMCICDREEGGKGYKAGSFFPFHHRLPDDSPVELREGQSYAVKSNYKV